MRKWINLFEGDNRVIKLRGFKVPEKCPSEQFLARLDDLGFRNPLNPRQIVLDGVKIEISRDLSSPEDTVHLSDMAAHESGAGGKALNLLCALADELHVSISLIAKGYAQTPTEVLVAWYICNGFHMEHHKADFEDGVDMTRNPLASTFTLSRGTCERSQENDEACRRGRLSAANSGGALGELSDAFYSYPVGKLHAVVPRLYTTFVEFS